MADYAFVNPLTGAALGDHAFGAIAAGTVSAVFAARLDYKLGQSGSGAPADALVVVLSDDGGATWRSDLRYIKTDITAVGNVPLDPLFTEIPRSLGTTSRSRLAPMRAGCYIDFAFTFTPDLRPGAAQTDLLWKAGLDFEQWEEIALVPDSPSGILTGLGNASVSEWITAPTLANGTDKVTLGAGAAVVAGINAVTAAGDVALSQVDGSAATLSSGEEYVAVLSVTTAGAVTVTKGDLATAGDALQPAYPAGQLLLAVVRVPYGGVIATSTLLAVSGRCAVADAGGLIVTVQPGRATSPGFLVTPATVQSLTLVDDTTNYVYLSEHAVANLVAGIPLATVVTAAGDITSVTDTRQTVSSTGGAGPALLVNLDCDGKTISNGFLDTMALAGALDANSQAITNLALANPDQPNNAASVRFVVSRPGKSYARLCATAPVTWPNVVANGTFATVLTPWSGTNWAQAAGAALHTAGSTDPLVQSVTIIDAVIYRITVTVSGAAGTVTPAIGADVGTPIAAGAGAVTQEILSTAGGTLNVGFAPTTDFDGALDNILVETVLYGLPDNIDSVAVANGNRVLLTAEAVDTRHGKWMVSTVAWARHPDCFEAYALYPGSGMYVSEGTANGRAYWVQTAAVADIATDPQTWEKAWALP